MLLAKVHYGSGVCYLVGRAEEVVVTQEEQLGLGAAGVVGLAVEARGLLRKYPTAL